MADEKKDETKPSRSELGNPATSWQYTKDFKPCPTCTVLTKVPHTAGQCKALLQDMAGSVFGVHTPGPEAWPAVKRLNYDELPDPPMGEKRESGKAPAKPPDEPLPSHVV